MLLKLDTLPDAGAAKLAAAGPAHVWAPIAAAIRDGRAEVFLCDRDTYVVTQLQGDTLVILAAAGCDAAAFVARFVEIGHAMRLRALRWHTRHRGLGRLLKQFEPVEIARRGAERVYEVAL